MNKDIKKCLNLYIEYGYISSYDYVRDEITIKYTLHNGLETERIINYNAINGNLDDFLNALLESAENLRDDIYNCLTDENDFFGYSSKEELEERIKEEETYLKSLVSIYKLRSTNNTRNNFNIKNNIFNLFENVRVLFNDFYIYGKEYSDKDIEKIKKIINKMKENIKDIESEMM